jgi:hypothetical protein
MLFNLDQAGRTTWAGSVRLLLLKYGFQDVWEAQEVENNIVFLREFTNRVKQAYDTEWEYGVSQCSKLSLYRQLKTNGISRENYLKNVTLKRYKAGLAKLRCSAHKLHIETGRHSGLQVADRVCQLCLKHRSFHVLEDEYHFLFCCPMYLDMRDLYLHEYIEAVSEQHRYESFLNLLSSTEEVVQRNVATYIYQANKLRTTLLSNI